MWTEGDKWFQAQTLAVRHQTPPEVLDPWRGELREAQVQARAEGNPAGISGAERHAPLPELLRSGDTGMATPTFPVIWGQRLTACAVSGPKERTWGGSKATDCTGATLLARMFIARQWQGQQPAAPRIRLCGWRFKRPPPPPIHASTLVADAGSIAWESPETGAHHVLTTESRCYRFAVGMFDIKLREPDGCPAPPFPIGAAAGTPRQRRSLGDLVSDRLKARRVHGWWIAPCFPIPLLPSVPRSGGGLRSAVQVGDQHW